MGSTAIVCLRFHAAALVASASLLRNCVPEIFCNKKGWVQNFSSCYRKVSLQGKPHLHIVSCRSLGNLFIGPKLRGLSPQIHPSEGF